MKLKFELEKNVNLVRFENKRIEISFNDNLDKNFVKDISTKLYDWTKERWIITFSKSKGNPSIKQNEIIKKTKLIEDAKNSNNYKLILDQFSDAELIEVQNHEEKND